MSTGAVDQLVYVYFTSRERILLLKWCIGVYMERIF